MLQQLGVFLSDPTSWFSVGAIIIGLAYIVFYDVIWTFVMKNAWSSWWFETAQTWIKVGVYLALFGLVAILLFVPWPWNLIIALAIILAVICLFTWRKRTKKITKM